MTDAPEPARLRRRGSCVCGGVRFVVEGDLPAPDACHCVTCRKFTGHYRASADVARSALVLERDETLAWYPTSEKVRRGFCSRCGSSLFFDPIDRDRHDWIGVYLGALDEPSDTRLAVHIFVEEKGDYYDLTDGLPQNPR